MKDNKRTLTFEFPPFPVEKDLVYPPNATLTEKLDIASRRMMRNYERQKEQERMEKQIEKEIEQALETIVQEELEKLLKPLQQIKIR